MQESEVNEIKLSNPNDILNNLKKEEREKEKKKQEKFSFETDFLNKKKCTIFYFGSNPIEQKCYHCIDSVDSIRKKKLKICQYCYENCHSECRVSSIVVAQGGDSQQKILQEEENINLGEVKRSSFACECGLKLKHKAIKKPPINIVPCNMMKLDQVLDVPKYHCKTHDMPICCVCSVLCHKDCEISKGKDVKGGINIGNRRCLCQTKKHTGYSELILTFPLDDYKNITEVPVWPVQILNILFASKEEFTKMSDLFIHTIENPNQKIDDYFYPLLELFSNTLNRKFKTFYYDEQFLKMFDYNKIIHFLFSLEVKNAKIALVKFRIIFILLFIHLKKDFIMHKTTTSVDFLSIPLMARLRYKNMIIMPCLINNEILDKYLHKDNSTLLDLTLIVISELIKTGMMYLSIEDNQDEFEIGLKFICFILKHMLLTKSQLNKLISSIYAFFNKFYEIIDKTNIYSLINIFSSLAEIFLEITVTYNDLVVDEYFTEEKLNSFIHKSHKDEEDIYTPAGEMIFEMLIKCCDVLKMHYNFLFMSNISQQGGVDKKFLSKQKKHEQRINMSKNSKFGQNVNRRFPQNGGLLIEKIVVILEETMNMFCLADNFYKKQISSIKRDDLSDYLLFKNQINHKTFGNFYSINSTDNSNKIFELKKNIENLLFNLFDSYSLQANNDIHDKIVELLDNFITDTNDIFKRLTTQLLNSKKGKENKIDRTQSMCDSTVSSYKDKIIKKIKDYFPFLNEESFNQEETKNNFIDSLCLYSLDETLSKLLVFFTNKRFPVFLNLQLFNRIIMFFRLYLLNKRGVEYFLLGKNFTRLSKIFRRFQCSKTGKNINEKLGKEFETNLKVSEMSLYFLVELGKSIRLFKLNIPYHKVLDRLHKHILEHLEVLCNPPNNLNYTGNDANYSFLTKKNFYLAFKFFTVYEDDYNQADYQEIKRELLDLFLHSPRIVAEGTNFVSELLKRNLSLKDKGSNHFSSTAFYQPSSKNFVFSQSGVFVDTHEEEIELKNFKKVLTFKSDNNQEDKKENKENNSNSGGTNKKDNDAGKVISNLIPIENLINEINIKLYFALFKLINKGLYSVYKGSQEEEMYDKIISLNPINQIRTELFLNKNKEYMNIKERAILLAFLRVLHLLDHCDKNDLFKKDFALNNQEFKELIYSKVINLKGLEEIKNINKEPFSINNINKLRIKYNKALDLEDLIDIYIEELKTFPSQCNNEDALNIFEYIKEIIYGVKGISDYFFINNDITNKIVLKFYLLIKHFLEKSNLITSMIEDIQKQGEILEEYPKTKDQEKIAILENKNIDIYDVQYLYSIINDEIFQIFAKTNLNEDYELQNYLDIFDNTNEANFTPFSLVETYDYEYFYQADSEKEEKEASKNKYNKLIMDLEKEYIEQFVDVTNTNYYNVFTNLSNENIRLDYRKKIVEYFISFFISSDSYQQTKISPLICIINKLLFYDGDEMQPRFKKLNENKYFFPIFNSRLHELIILTIISSKNSFNFKQSMNNILLCKLFIQFLQLLGEGFNLDYHDNIFLISKNTKTILEKQKTRTTKEETDRNIDKDDSLNKNTGRNLIKKLKTYRIEKNDIQITDETIFQFLVGTLKKCFFLVQVGARVEGELPYDKLIVLITNIVDFLIEFKETTEENNSFLVENVLDLFFGENVTNNSDYYQSLIKKGVLKEALAANVSSTNKGEDEIFFYNTASVANEAEDEQAKEQFSLRKKVICFLKIKFVDLLTNYINLGKHSKIYDNIKAKQINSLYLFKIILIHFKQLIFQIKSKNQALYEDLIKIQSDNSFVDILINIYSKGEIFNDIIEFPLITKLYLLIKILQELYDDKSLSNNLTKIKNTKPVQKYKLNQEKNLGIDSYFAIRVHLFLETLILKVEIKNSDEGDEEEEDDNEEIIKNEDIGDVSKLIYNKIFQYSEEEKKDKNAEKVAKQTATNIAFFIRPSLTFRLSNESKTNFENNVNRTNATDKYIGLIKFSDYALFEMIVNQHIIGNRRFSKFLSSISYKIVEYINYVLIIVQNILIMRHFYKSPNSDPEDYDVKEKNAVTKQFTDNLIIAIIQVVFTGLMTINWFFFKFILTLQKNIMDSEDMNFVFKKKGDENTIPLKIVEYFQNKDVSTFSMFSERTNDISLFKIIIIAIFPSLLLNTEINMIFFTLILSAIYIKTGVSLLLIIPILAIANINKILGNIFSAMIQNIRHMSLVILFILMITYIYSWFSYYFLDTFFNFDVMEYESKQSVEEPYCKSIIQCFLCVTQYGLTAGGGIGEQLDKVSYKESPGYFVLRFFYDILFFSFVTLILFNIFTGIIVGAFAELRDETNKNEKDKKDKCFICQLSRDDCLKKNKDFNYHVNQEHYLWNYLYFLTYLHINDPNNFNSIENYVWEKLEQQDNSWIPLEKNSE